MNPAIIMKSTKALFNWYFSRSALPYWGVLLLDSLFVMISGILAFGIRHGIGSLLDSFGPLCLTLCIFLGFYIVSFRIFHTYNGIIRYSSSTDLMKVSSAILLATALSVTATLIIGTKNLPLTFDYADIVMMAFFVICLMWLMRVWVKTLYEAANNDSGRVRAFILGVGDSGSSLARDICSSPDSEYSLEGFVSIDPLLSGHSVSAKKIWAFDKTLPSTMHRLGIKALLVSPTLASVLGENDDIAEELVREGIRIMIVSHPREWKGKGELRASTLRPINVEDLLPRNQIEVDMEAAARLLRDHVVMITGAAGSIGSEIVRQIAAYSPSHIVLVDQAESPMHDMRLEMRDNWPDIPTETIVANIADPIIMERIFRRFRPEYVFHAAAYKHVPMMEDNPYEAVENNIRGTRVIADLAVKYSTRKFVMVSTDKAVNPTNVMGCSKRICEIYVQSLDKAIKEGTVKGVTQFVTTRFGNVLGSNGSVIPIFERQIREGGPVTVTHPDIIRFFMLISEACKLVIEAGTMGKGGEIYVFDMGKPVHIAELAKRMILLSGANDVEIKYTGLRDGEKLYEEILNDKETTMPTFHDKIKIAKVREYSFSDVERRISELIDMAADSDDMGIVAAMKGIVPEYHSHHSRYEVLDRVN